MDRSFIFQLIKIYCKAVSSSLSLLLLDVFVYYIVSQQNNTDVGHYNFSAHQPILVIFGEMLLRQYAIKWWFVISLLLTNVSALSGRTWTPEIVPYSRPISFWR